MRVCAAQQGTGCVRLPAAAQKQDEAHDVFVLFRLVGVNRDRRNLPVVVQYDISGRGSTWILGPAAAKAKFDFLENLPMRSVALVCGFEPLRIASVGPRSVERTVPPA